jgi:hypothetical protein
MKKIAMTSRQEEWIKSAPNKELTIEDKKKLKTLFNSIKDLKELPIE